MAISNNGLALEFASEKLKNNFNIVSTAVNKNGESIQFASPELKENVDIAYAAFKNSNYFIFKNYISEKALNQVFERYSNEIEKDDL
jgi:hypothetical protein